MSTSLWPFADCMCAEFMSCFGGIISSYSSVSIPHMYVAFYKIFMCLPKISTTSQVTVFKRLCQIPLYLHMYRTFYKTLFHLTDIATMFLCLRGVVVLLLFGVWGV